jgi:P-type Ca2+ transporter type 2C
MVQAASIQAMQAMQAAPSPPIGLTEHEAAALLVSVLVVAGITVVQAHRTERVLASLKALASPRSRVVRGGQVKHIASEGLVVGDHLLIASGSMPRANVLLAAGVATLARTKASRSPATRTPRAAIAKV